MELFPIPVFDIISSLQSFNFSKQLIFVQFDVKLNEWRDAINIK
jgi:hypothetical protein